MKANFRLWIIICTLCMPTVGLSYGLSDSLAIEVQIIDSLISTSSYDEALDRSFALESKASTTNEGHLINQSRFSQARIYNFKTDYVTSDSLLDILMTQNVSHDIKFNGKLLLYNNAMRRSYTDKALSILDELDQSLSELNPNQLLRYRNARADFYTLEEDYPKALEHLLLAKEEIQDDVPHGSEFNLNYQLGALYNAIGVYDQAASIGEENQQLALSHSNFYLELFSIFTQIEAQEKMNNHETVNELFRRAEYLRIEKNLNTSYGFIYYAKGRSHYTKNELDSALYYYNKGIVISKKLKSKKEKFENLLGKGLVHLKLGEIPMAKRCLESAEKIKQYDHEDFERLKIGLSLEDRNYLSAYENSELLLNKLESKGDGKNSYEIISTLLTDKFDREKRENRLIREQNEDRRNNHLTFFILGILAMFFSLLSFLLHRNKRSLEKLNSDLQSKNEALLNFSYISSHDLKEPARNIASFTDLLINQDEKTRTPQEYNEILEIINNSSKTLLEIVKSLGIFSETALNEKAFNLEVVNIREVMDDVNRNLNQLVNDTNANIEYIQESKITTIDYSKPMLYLLLKNLIQNAIKYNKSMKPEVKVNVVLDIQSYLFSVTDNGLGIREDKLDYIFKPFRTLQNKSLNQSSGLGLSICKNIVEKFGGKIWVDTKQNEGSTFYFTVPRK